MPQAMPPNALIRNERIVAVLDHDCTHFGIGEEPQQFASLTIEARANSANRLDNVKIALRGVLPEPRHLPSKIAELIVVTRARMERNGCRLFIYQEATRIVPPGICRQGSRIVSSFTAPCRFVRDALTPCPLDELHHLRLLYEHMFVYMRPQSAQPFPSFRSLFATASRYRRVFALQQPFGDEQRCEVVDRHGR